MGTIVFFYFASVIVVTAALVVALRNPVYNALALLVMFFHVAGLFVTLHAEFLAVIQILVYAGAILVLVWSKNSSSLAVSEKLSYFNADNR